MHTMISAVAFVVDTRACLNVRLRQAFVEFTAFFVNDNDETLLTDWVGVHQLRPLPPPPTPHYFEMIQLGEPLDLYHEDGWWEVVLQRSRLTPKGGLAFQVVSPLYGTERWSSSEHLRPRWDFVRCPRLGEHWRSEGTTGTAVWDTTLSYDPQQMAADAAASAASNETAAAVAAGRPDSVEGEHALALAGSDAAALEQAWGATAAQDGGESSGAGASGAEGGASDAGAEQAHLRWQLETLHRLAHEYHERVVEVRRAAMRLFPIAQSAVANAGGTLTQPECLARALPPLPPLPSVPPPSPPSQPAAFE